MKVYFTWCGNRYVRVVRMLYPTHLPRRPIARKPPCIYYLLGKEQCFFIAMFFWYLANCCFSHVHSVVSNIFCVVLMVKLFNGKYDVDVNLN